MNSCRDCRWLETFFVDDTLEVNGICYNENVEDKLLRYNKYHCPHWETKYEYEED